MKVKELKDGFQIILNGSKIISEVKLDVFNSSVFSLKMCNIHINNSKYISENLLDKIINRSMEKGFEHLSIKVDTTSIDLILLLQKKGFILVDTLVTYLRLPQDNNIDIANDYIKINENKVLDLEKLKKMGKDSFSITRFHNDPYLFKDASNEYYSLWIENSVKGYSDNYYVATLNGIEVGFLSTKKIDEKIMIDLNLVSKEYRKKGIYSTLLSRVINEANLENKSIIVGTQLNNLNVQSVWNKFGFKIFDSKYVFHKKINKED